MNGNGAAAARERVLQEIRTGQGFCLVTHEHPDGDALGSLVAMHRILTALGKDSVMLMAADEFPLPYEYRFLTLEGLVGILPDDLSERTLVVLDCGNMDRNPFAASLPEGDERPERVAVGAAVRDEREALPVAQRRDSLLTRRGADPGDGHASPPASRLISCSSCIARSVVSS